MPKKTILSVGFSFPGGEVEELPFSSKRTLLDGDIAIFKPSFKLYQYQDFPDINAHALKQREWEKLKSDLLHWYQEIAQLLKLGNTVIILLSGVQSISLQETKDYSPSNYNSVPFAFSKLEAKTGKEMKLVSKDEAFINYWHEFGRYSEYNVHIEGDFTEILLTTKFGGKIIGAYSRKEKGCIVFLPSIVYDEDEFTEEEDDEQYWTKEAEIFGKKLVHHFIEIDNFIRSSHEFTAPPSWSLDEKYIFREEKQLQNQLIELRQQIEAAEYTKSRLEEAIHKEGDLRRLLYGTGRQLENAVHDALSLLGFNVDRYTDHESEFDAVFISAEGRFLGEVEGKENKAINIDKLMQLERNLQEDMNREDVEGYAKGVLFGNAYRLSEPEKRSEYFTNKCLQTAAHYKMALVRTPDLFEAAKYLKEHNDPDFARKCREAIKLTEGEIVKFPQVPSNES